MEILATPVMDLEHLVTQEARAPGSAELWLDRETPPVYRNLEEKLLRARTHPDPEVAHVMATCAAYSYAGPKTVSMIMARMGLEDNQCRMVQLSVDAMLLRSTAFVVQSKSGRVAILCYRGTEPLNLINWLLSIDVKPERMSYQIGTGCPTVHGGFYRNTLATREEMMKTLERACDGRSVLTRAKHDGDGDADADRPVDNRLEALYITGHSLGGAMAALMAVMMRHEETLRTVVSDRLRAVYTFGQPMVGNRDFAKNCEDDRFLRDNVIRYIYQNDVVPHLPPGSSGQFQHFGREYRYRVPLLNNILGGLLGAAGRECQSPLGKWAESQRRVSQAAGVTAVLLADLAYAVRIFQVARALPTPYSVDDHIPRHYVSALTPPGVKSEFGV